MKYLPIFLLCLMLVIPVSADYVLQFQALTNSPADGATNYIGFNPVAPTTTVNISVIVIPKDGIIDIAEIYDYSGTAGTNQAYTYYIRKNNTEDHLIKSLSVATSERVFSNTSMGIAVKAGDWIELKRVHPTWTTNPLTNIVGGYVHINTTPVWNTNQGYTMHYQALTNSPPDSEWNNMSAMPRPPSNIPSSRYQEIPSYGTATIGWVNDYSGTAGTAEAYPYYLSKNWGGADLINSLSVSANARQYFNTSMTLPVITGDNLILSRLNPAWATNPLTNTLGGYAFIDTSAVANRSRGYALVVESLAVSPSDGTTYYLGNRPMAASSSAGTNKIYIRQAGTITAARIYSYAGTAGTAESWSLYIRKNNTEDFPISSVALSNNFRNWTNSAMTVPVAVGDYIEIKATSPTWATNPASWETYGYVYLEYADYRPIPKFSATPTAGTPPLTVSFTDATATTPTGWEWNWTCLENGTTVLFNTSQNPQQTFDTGHFRIDLTAYNASGYRENTTTGVTISAGPSAGYDGFNQQDIWMEGSFLLIIHPKDHTTGAPILEATVVDQNGQSYSCTNGTAFLTEPAGPVYVYTIADGYQTTMDTYYMDEDREEDVTMSPSTTTTANSSSVQYSVSHNVKILVKDAWVGPLEGVNVTATYVEASGPLDWLFAWIGLLSNPGADVTNTTLFAHTGSDGAVNFLMVESVQYNITAYKPGVIDQQILIYPKDDEYTIWTVGGINKTMLYQSGYNELDEVRVSANGTEVNQTWGRIMVSYADGLNQTQSVLIQVNQSHTYGNITNETAVTNTSVALNSNFTSTLYVQNHRDQSYVVHVDARHTTFGNISRGFGITYPPGPISLGFPEELLHLIGMGMLFFVTLCFVRTLPGPTVIVDMFLAWIMFFMRWWRELAPPEIVVSALVGATVFAIIYNIMLRSKKLPME